jgi:hypothetical protein
MSAKRQLEAFKAMVKDSRKSSHYFEETDGNRRKWKDLSAEGKLQYIARDAALCEVAYETFAEAARDSLGKSSVTEAALRTVLRDAHEFRGLEQLLPPDGRTESTPLIDRFKEILNHPSEPGQVPEQSKDRGIER